MEFDNDKTTLQSSTCTTSIEQLNIKIELRHVMKIQRQKENK